MELGKAARTPCLRATFLWRKVARFLIARASIHEPKRLVLAEPSTALDFAARLVMLGHLRSIVNTTGNIVLVTHNPGEILPEIDSVILFQAGHVIADGSKKQVLTSSSLSELYGMHLKLQWNGG